MEQWHNYILLRQRWTGCTGESLNESYDKLSQVHYTVQSKLLEVVKWIKNRFFLTVVNWA